MSACEGKGVEAGGVMGGGSLCIKHSIKKLSHKETGTGKNTEGA